VLPFVAASLAASRERYADKPGEARLRIGNEGSSAVVGGTSFATFLRKMVEATAIASPLSVY
jgi:hypothetical protein